MTPREAEAENIRFNLIVFQIVSLARGDTEARSVAVACIPILEQLGRMAIEQAVMIDRADLEPSGPHLTPVA